MTTGTSARPATGDLALLTAALLLPLSWAGLNAGSGRAIDGTWGVDLGTLRSIAPLFVAATGLLLVAVFAWQASQDQHRRTLGGPLWLLVAYVAVGLASSVVANLDRGIGIYWGLSYLAVPLVAIVFSLHTNLLEPKDLLRGTLGIALATAVVLGTVFVVEFSLIEALLDGRLFRAQGFYTREPPVDAFVINANGAGRFAAVAILAATGYLLSGSSKPWELRLGAGAIVAFLAILLLFSQSRSAFAGILVALPLLVLLHRGWGPVLIAVGIAAMGLLLLGTGGTVWSFLTRGETLARLAEFGGRSARWDHLVDLIAQAPFIGHGFHADRLLIGVQAENAWLHASLQAGLVGGLLFAGAWVWTWVNIFRLGVRRRFEDVARSDRNLLILATALLAFFTLRSIPQSTAAYYGVDLLIVVPVMGYVHAVARRHLTDDPTPEPTTEEATTREPRVLACAYAAAPPGSETFHGGEELLGWRLTNAAGRHGDVHALVSAEHQDSIEQHLTEAADEGDAAPTFHPVGLPSWMAWMRNHQGTIQLYAYLWQIKAFLVARRLHEEIEFDLFHHITYANDWMASYIGAFLDVPYVRGPGGGAHRVPKPMLEDRGVRFRLAQRWRSGMQRVLRADPVFRLGQNRADRILVCTRESMDALPDRWRSKAELFPVNGIDPADYPDEPAWEGGEDRFTVLTAGKLLEIKGFDLAIRAFAEFVERTRRGRLIIVGDGPQRERLEALADELGVAERVRFEGWRPHRELLELMAGSDVFLFASMRDGGGAVVVEAMGAGTPVVCLDVAGPGVHVDASCGLKVGPATPSLVVQGLAYQLERLHKHPGLRETMSRQARRRALEDYRWERHGDRLGRIYRKVLGEHGFLEDGSSRSAKFKPVEAPKRAAGDERVHRVRRA